MHTSIFPMMAPCRFLLRSPACVACLLILLSPADGAAQVGFGVGAKGGMDLSYLSEPASDPTDTFLPGFAGPGGAVGLSFDLIVFDVIGVEVDVLFARHGGSGTTIVEAASGGSMEINWELTSSALHIPLLIKARLPLGPVTPLIAIGPEFVIGLDADFTGISDLQIPFATEGQAASYVMLTLALGADIDALAVTIPVELRLSVQPGLSDSPASRATFSPSMEAFDDVAVQASWETHFQIFVGVRFDL